MQAQQPWCAPSPCRHALETDNARREYLRRALVAAEPQPTLPGRPGDAGTGAGHARPTPSSPPVGAQAGKGTHGGRDAAVTRQSEQAQPGSQAEAGRKSERDAAEPSQHDAHAFDPDARGLDSSAAWRLPEQVLQTDGGFLLAGALSPRGTEGRARKHAGAAECWGSLGPPRPSFRLAPPPATYDGTCMDMACALAVRLTPEDMEVGGVGDAGRAREASPGHDLAQPGGITALRSGTAADPAQGT